MVNFDQFHFKRLLDEFTFPTSEILVDFRTLPSVVFERREETTLTNSTISHFNSAADSTKQFHEQVQVLTKNLGSLNAIYELELQDTNNHLKAMNNFYGNLVQASQTMQGSVEDAKKAHDQIAKLAGNLSNLNTIYGNMLSAMQGR